MKNEFLDKIYQKFSFSFLDKIEDSLKIDLIKNEIGIILIDIMKYFNEEYLIICFEGTIILVSKTKVSFLENFFMNQKHSKIIAISNKIGGIIPEYIRIDDEESKEMIKIYNQIKENEKSRFFKYFKIESPINEEFNNIWQEIGRSILILIVIKSYSKINKNRFSDFRTFLNNKEDEKIKKNENNDNIDIELNNFNHIKIADLGSGNSATTLICHLELEQLFAMKIFYSEDYKKLIEREKRNYEKIHHPLIPKFYGICRMNKKESLLIEYIKGHSLNEIKEMKLKNEDKIIIIYEMLKIIEYLHNNGFIYRDMKPDNFIIDESKALVLIDFDRMLIKDDEQITKNFASIYIAPEIYDKTKRYSFEVDIYSLGLILYFIIMGKELPINSESQSMNIFDGFHKEFLEMIEIIKSCIIIDGSSRPTIDEIIQIFLENYSLLLSICGIIKRMNRENYSTIHIYPKRKEDEFNFGEFYYKGKKGPQDINKAIYHFQRTANENDPKGQFYLGEIYYEDKYVPRDINKAIHYYSLAANQNYRPAQFYLGKIYYEGKYVQRDINESIHYFSLAANQRNPAAQFYLGKIYYEGKYVPLDINKAIHYFSLAAKQNYPASQFYLGKIYYEGKYVQRDINKAIHYFSLEANQKDLTAQLVLADIYYEGKYVQQDINKAIHYYSLAANQNSPTGLFNLGIIYFDNINVQRDINKAIYYFSLAANQKHHGAQFNLVDIYYNGKYVERDINKAIHYLSLAASQNSPSAQFILGMIYLENKYIQRDINKAIRYFSLAANQNTTEAQFILGKIYYEGEYVQRDINKAIHYFSRAANQNDPDAQLTLGRIYYDGIYVPRDIKKGIYYMSLAANQNNPKAQFELGRIYYLGKHIQQDINKTIHYFSLAANQNDINAQFFLGLMYYGGSYVKQDISKARHYISCAANQNNSVIQRKVGRYYYDGIVFEQNFNIAIRYFSLSAKNGDIKSNFILGVIYSQGIHIERNFDEAIHYYNNGSNRRDNYSKNNLGIIYKYHEYKKNPIEYFEESIIENEDAISMYNLGHMYFYGEKVKHDLDKSIHLLIKSSMKGFDHAKILLSIALVKNLTTSKITKERIKEEMNKYINTENIHKLSDEIIVIIQLLKLGNNYRDFYHSYEKIDFTYDIHRKPMITSDFYSEREKKIKEKEEKNKNLHDINELFYEGFGYSMI